MQRAMTLGHTTTLNAWGQIRKPVFGARVFLFSSPSLLLLRTRAAAMVLIPVRYNSNSSSSSSSSSSLSSSTPTPDWIPGIRFLKIVSLASICGAVLVGASLVGLGLYGATSINSTRNRWFADDFVLTPESLRMPYNQVEFRTDDGILLRGWWIPQTIRGHPSDRVVMCCAPFLHDKSTLLAIARGLWESGHSVFLFDFRSHGPVPTNHTIGYLEELDGKAAMKWLRENGPKDAKISLMGCSMGGAIALCLAGDEAMNGRKITGVATDCAFSNLKHVLRHYVDLTIFGSNHKGPRSGRNILARCVPPSLHGVVIDFVLEVTCFANELFYGYNPANVGPSRVLSHIDIPLLILHCTDDSIIPPTEANRIYEGVSTPEHKKRLLMVPGEHISSYFQNEHVYIRRLVQFLDHCYEGNDSSTAELKLVRSPSDVAVTRLPVTIPKV